MCIIVKFGTFIGQGVSQSLTGLYVTSVQFKHSGKYTCRAQTTHEHYEAWAYLTVLGEFTSTSGI